MKHFFQSTMLAAFLLAPGAAWAGHHGNTHACECEKCHKDCKCGKDGKCDENCNCKKDGECGADCGCDKKKK